jgi:hypothetical protein
LGGGTILDIRNVWFVGRVAQGGVCDETTRDPACGVAAA